MNIVKNKRAFVKIFLSIVIIFLLCTIYYLLITEANAQSFGSASVRLEETVNKVQDLGGNPWEKPDSLAAMVGTIIYAVLGFLGIICLILIIAAGIMIMTAEGNEETITKAKGIIKGAILGVIVILAAYAITFFVVTKVLESTERGLDTGPGPVGGVRGTTCTTSADCSPGWECINSRCMPEYNPCYCYKWGEQSSNCVNEATRDNECPDDYHCFICN